MPAEFALLKIPTFVPSTSWFLGFFFVNSSISNLENAAEEVACLPTTYADVRLIDNSCITFFRRWMALCLKDGPSRFAQPAKSLNQVATATAAAVAVMAVTHKPGSSRKNAMRGQRANVRVGMPAGSRTKGRDQQA